MIRILAVATTLSLLAPAGVQARAPEPKSSPYDRCLAGPASRTRAGEIACVTAETQRQNVIVDRRYKVLLSELNAAYSADSWRRGQQAWMAFRDADCAVYASKTWGATGDLDARKCVLERTSDRADEIGFYTSDDSDTPPPPPPSTLKKPKGPMSAYERCMSRPKQAWRMEAMACTAEETDRQDARLNRVYKALLGRLSPGDRDGMRAAQRAWIAYRDGDRDMLLDDSMWGRDASATYGERILDRTIARADQLEAFITAHGLQAPR